LTIGVPPAALPRGDALAASGPKDERRDPRPLGERPHAVPVAFLVGSARSGSSLLYKCLALHPNAAWISNWRSRFPRAPGVDALALIARRFSERTREVWFADDNAYVYGGRRKLLDRLYPMPVEGEPVYTRAGVGRPGGPSPRTAEPRHALPGAFGTIVGRSGAEVMITKRIANNLRIPLLAEIFPEARFVDLVRDGRAVASSLARVDWWPQSHVWWYGGTPEGWAAEGRDPWEICARNWVEEVRAIRGGLGSVPTKNILRLRYEELIADPLGELSRVARFIGLPLDDEWIGALESLSFPDRTQRWREILPPAVAEPITAIQRKELITHGYTP